MSLIIKGARLALFGVDMSKKKPSLRNVVTTWALNRGRRMIGLPAQSGHSLWDWLMHQGQLLLADLFGWQTGPTLPDDLPVALFTALDETLRNRGGLSDKGSNLPNFWLDNRSALSTPFFWSLQVNYSPFADISKVSGFEMALEDAITRSGYDYNIRIQKRPLRIEVDKPAPPTITLTELWPTVEALKHDERLCVVGLAYLSGATASLTMSLTGEDFSAFIAGSPGSGKTQLAMSIILGLAMSNNPTTLTMVIIDPKSVDFRPFNRLPHLALPVINEPSLAAELVQALCQEMEKRTAQAARGDNSFFAHSILLYLDEMADLIASLPDSQAQELVKNLQRLCMKGRALGFVIIGATQRVYDIPVAAYSKLTAKFAGKTRNANDSQAISGIPGTTTNKLPGRGSFELYCSDQTGLRIQAPFVAASDKRDYERQLNPFFDAIAQRWQAQQPGWMVPGSNQPTTNEISTEDEPIVDEEPVEKIEIDVRLWQAMTEAYKAGKLTATLVRRLHVGVLHRTIDGYKAKAIFDAFLQAQQNGMASSSAD